MQLSQEQQSAFNKIVEKNKGVQSAQNVSREQARQLIGLDDVQKQAKENLGFLGRVKERFQGAAERSTRDIGNAIASQERGEQGTARTAFQSLGSVLLGGADVVYGTLIDAAIPEPVAQLAKDKFSELASTSAGKSALDALASGVETVESIAAKNPKMARDIKALVGYVELVPGAKVVTGGIQKAGTATRASTRRIFDTTKSVEDRIKNVRDTVSTRFTKNATDDAFEMGAEQTARQSAQGAGQAAQEASEPIIDKVARTFSENPTISGAIDDIKVMVGLPDSAPAVDLTFRAIKPRLTKNKDLRRIKSQMELANQTLVENGMAKRIIDSENTVKEYADAIYDTKRQVWSQIQSSLDSGAAQNLKIDLVPVAIEMLDMASDPALLRTNRKAAEQITKIAEDLIQYGDDVDILEAERIKQLINAELDGSFGNFDLSEQAKNAKKKITAYIGRELDGKLSEVPGEFRDLKIKYGALSAVEEDALKRAIVFERQNPEGLADMLSKTEAAADIAFGGVQGRLRGVARLTMQSRLKKSNDANELVKRAFEKLGVKENFNKAAMPEMANVSKSSLLGGKREFAKNLSADDRAIETAAFSRIDNEWDVLKNEYIQNNNKVVNADEFRALFPGYNGANAAVVQEPSSEASKVLLKQLLDEQPKGSTVYATAGGAGSGKSTASKEFHLFDDKKDLIFDSVLKSKEKAVQFIDDANTRGLKPKIVYVYRDMEDAWKNGVEPRRVKTGRAVPRSVHENGHAGALQTIKDILTDNALRGKFELEIIDNSLGRGNARLVNPAEYADFLRNK